MLKKSKKSSDVEHKSTKQKKSGKSKSRGKKSKKRSKDARDKTSLKISEKKEKVVRHEIPSGDDDHLVQLLEIKRKYQQALEKTGKTPGQVMSAEEVRELTGTKVEKKPDPEEEKKKKIDRGTLDFLFG